MKIKHCLAAENLYH